MSEIEKQIFTIILDHIIVCDDRFADIKKADDIIRFRDFISHHYELLDHEIVFN